MNDPRSSRASSVVSAVAFTVLSACSGNGAGPSDANQAKAGPIPGGALPCAISEILATNCQSCHGAMPLNGAPMSLVTLPDLLAPAHSDASRKVFELAAQRIQDRARPMPPDPSKRLSDAAISALQAWAASGAQPGAACVAAAAGSTGGPAGAAAGASLAGTAGASVATGMAGHAAAAGSGGAARASSDSAGAPAVAGAAGGASDPGDADIESCYELRAHGQTMPGDKTPYTVPIGETYTSFIFKAPWTTPVQGLRFRHRPDNVAVVHHWLLYVEHANAADGDVEPCPLAGPTGFLCGQASTRALITGWAPGRQDFRLPAGVGLELPAPGSLLALEVHYNNNTSGMTAQDQSGAELCVTSKFRANTAGVTWLGTQSINIPAHTQGTASGTCKPLRMGLGAADPIHILYSWPHMHRLGRHLKSLVQRVAGGQDVLYDGDFSFEFQVSHDSPLLLQPGDSLITTCSYENSTDGSVSFGQSTDKEMCFNFTYAWPAHALDNPGAELGGASNTCLH
jgi:hypothetical protein